jgi:hypothetical protein
MPTVTDHAAPREFAVYLLTDPRDGRPRYVGSTSQRPAARARAQLIDARWRRRHGKRRCAKVEWLLELLDLGLEPGLVVVAAGLADLADAIALERTYAALPGLTNVQTPHPSKPVGPESAAVVAAKREAWRRRREHPERYERSYPFRALD